tara:strand:+ start:2357 stop:3925 length:1569 start_codon:yes stop_codon:yes gene_type:complete
MKINRNHRPRTRKNLTRSRTSTSNLNKVNGMYDMKNGWLCPTPVQNSECKYTGNSSSNQIVNKPNKTHPILPYTPGVPGQQNPNTGMWSNRPYHNPIYDEVYNPWWTEGDMPMEVFPWEIRVRRKRPSEECFVAGTKVIMGDGNNKNIEDIKVGDVVLSYNLENLIFENKSVVELLNDVHDGKDGDHTMIMKFSDGSQNHNTTTNPYWVKDKGWATLDVERHKRLYKWDCVEIEVGDICYKYIDGKLEEIELVSIEEIFEEIKTFNIIVEDNHNFFATDILVHNKHGGQHPPGAPPPPPGPPPGGNTTTYTCYNGGCVAVDGGWGEFGSMSSCNQACQNGQYKCTGMGHCYSCLNSEYNGYPMLETCGMEYNNNQHCGNFDCGGSSYCHKPNYGICGLFRTQQNCEAGKLVNPYANQTGEEIQTGIWSDVSSYDATMYLISSPFGNSGNKYLLPAPLGNQDWADGIGPHPPTWYLDMTSGQGYAFGGDWDWGFDNINQHTDLFWETNQAAYGCVWTYWAGGT